MLQELSKDKLGWCLREVNSLGRKNNGFSYKEDSFLPSIQVLGLGSLKMYHSSKVGCPKHEAHLTAGPGGRFWKAWRRRTGPKSYRWEPGKKRLEEET